MSELIMEIKPKFCWFQRAFVNFRVCYGLACLVMFFATIFLTFIRFIPVQTDYATEAKMILYMRIFVVMIVSFLISYPLITTLFGFLDKKNFEVTNYKIYDDRIDFDEGFINHKHVSILFKDIKEIHLDQNFIQRRYNIATIRFVTSANNSGNVYAHVGVKFQDIENAKDVYTKVKEIYDNVNKGD